MNRRTLMASTAALLTLAACADERGMSATSAAPQGDIVDVAAGAGQFQTLVAAVTAAGLVDTLKSPGPFTVFAPTDAAFAALAPGTVDDLLKPENKAALTQILTYHVVPGAVRAEALASKVMEVTSVEGGALSVNGTSGVTVNGARVITANVEASNGVIHVIDGVLLPPSL